MMRILFIAPGDNVHTWKWVGWFGRKYPGEIGLIPYQDPALSDKLPGVEIIEPAIPPFRLLSPESWAEFGRITELVKDIGPGLLHALWVYGPGIYAGRSNYHPFLLSPWGSDVTVYPNRKWMKGLIQRNLVLGALAEADCITATSNFLANAIHGLVPEMDRPEILTYGVDTSIFDPAKIDKQYVFDWPDGAPEGQDAVTVGFFKKLDITYGPDILIEAIAKGAKIVRGLRCVIGGSGPMLPKLREQSKSLGVADRICFAGLIPHSDMPRALASIDIFAMPSRYEVLGVGALEASAMAKPVIVSRKWGMVEVIEDGVTGYLVEAGNPDDLTVRIIELAGDPENRRRLGESGRSFVKTNYEFEPIMESADRLCNRLIEMYS